MTFLSISTEVARRRVPKLSASPSPLQVVIPPDVRQAVEGAAPHGAMCCTVPVDGMSSWGAVLAEYVVTSILLAVVCADIANAAASTPSSTPSAPPAFTFGVLITGICVLEVHSDNSVAKLVTKWLLILGMYKHVTKSEYKGA